MTINITVTVLGFEVPLSAFIEFLAKEEYETLKSEEDKDAIEDLMGHFKYGLNFQPFEALPKQKFIHEKYETVEYSDVYTFIYHHDHPRYSDPDTTVIVGIPVSYVCTSDFVPEYMKIEVDKSPSDILHTIEEYLPKIAKLLKMQEIPKLGYFTTTDDCGCCS